MSQDKELIGLAVAATELGVSGRTLRKAASEGLLHAKKIAGVWLVSRAEVKRYIREDKRTVGRPPTKKS
jgi:hypothetical protein